MNDEHAFFGIPILAEKLGLPHPIWTLIGLLVLLALAFWLAIVGLPVVDRYLPGGAVTTQGVLELLWLADMRLGFLGHRQAYRQRYGRWAYQQAAVRYFLLAFVLMMVGLIRPAFVSGAPLYSNLPGDLLGTLLIVQGAALGVRAFQAFGLDRATLVYSYFPEEDRLVNSQIYTFVRHPLYAMWMHISLGLALVSNNMIALGCAATFIAKTLIWTRWEESELLERFGTNYEEYRRRTPAFFPRLRALPAFWRMLIKETRT